MVFQVYTNSKAGIMDQYAVFEALPEHPDDTNEVGRFVLVFKSGELPRGAFMKTSDPMPESEIRKQLAARGARRHKLIPLSGRLVHATSGVSGP